MALSDFPHAPLQGAVISRDMFLRAGLFGLCLGFIVIGLLENRDRFSDPDTLYAERHHATPAENASFNREDRLDSELITGSIRSTDLY